MSARSGRRRAPRIPPLPIVVLAVLAPLVAACGLPALIHDQILGPVSPAGEVRPATIGTGFRVTDEGVVVEDPGEAVLRPHPPDVIRRAAQPLSFYYIVKACEAVIAGISPIVKRDTDLGRPLPEEALARLEPGIGAAQVLDLLGPPQRWIRRREGSLMTYRAVAGRSVSFYVGLPPGVADLMPVPGLNALYFRYTSSERTPRQTVLLFDGVGRLRAAASHPGEEAREGSEP